jgi:hypothetical protein
MLVALQEYLHWSSCMKATRRRQSKAKHIVLLLLLLIIIKEEKGEELKSYLVDLEKHPFG